MSYIISFPRRPFRRDKSREPIKTTREFITEVGISLVEVTLELQGFFTLEMHLVLISRKLFSKYVPFNKAVLAMILRIAEGSVFHDHVGFPLRPFTDLLCIHYYHPTLYTVKPPLSGQ